MRWGEGVRKSLLLGSGVVLPVAALLVELTTRMSADVFFDPLPTLGHALLVAFVAVANGWTWFVVSRNKAAQVRWAAVANGFAIGIALVYSILFLPLLPISTIAILWFGLGALGLAPLASLIVAFRLRVLLSRRTEQKSIVRRTWTGVTLGILSLFALDLPSTITRMGARMATGDTIETRTRGIRLLRALGSENELLRMCYVRSGATTDLLGFLIDPTRTLTPETARQLYYRMTGRAFNSVPAPVKVRFGRGGLLDWDTWDDWDDWDDGQGGDAVGGRVRDLWLASSRLDGSVSADAALGYLEWTMVFRNSSQAQREARAQIALPPGAVVSRVTLWIDGEEREAAFAGRRQVREAYQAVVRQRRDPVLVTSAGPDRISMQLFPVPPSGEMKVRIGMTMPLGLASAHEAALRLPYFHERNFDVRDDLRHGVWIESKARLRSALVPPGDGADAGAFRADVEDARLHGRDASILVARSSKSVAWSADMQSAGYVVRQTIGEDSTASRPRGLVIVVDGSASMQDSAARVAKDLAALPESVNVRLIFAQDESELAPEGHLLSGAEAAKQVAELDYAGGHDNTVALARGVDLAFAQSSYALLWIHGPQPVLLETEEALLQRLSRGPKLSKWYELQVAPGRNLVTEKLDGIASIETLRGDDLERIVSAWRAGNRSVSVRRERIEASENVMPVVERTSDHLVRLWANDEIARLIQGGAEQRKAAIELAQRYQLVTPISGAVVLETQQQYDAAGLQPVPEGTVPTIPEPEEWALIVIALLVIAYAYRRRRALLIARAA
jgi:hypothetical protein